MAVTAKPDQVHYGGCDIEFVGEVPERFICNICTKVLRDPHLTGCCGQHFCESCLTHWFNKHKSKTCPHCREKNLAHMQNKALKREISELKVCCTLRREGCKWQGELGQLQVHLNSNTGCGFVEVECQNGCGTRSLVVTTKMKRKDMEEHLMNECYLRRYKCEHCKLVDTYEAITGKGHELSMFGIRRWCSHYDQCPMFPLDCPNDCGARKIKRKDMSSHREQCPLEKLKCPNQCKEKRPQRIWWSPLGYGDKAEARVLVSQIKRKDLPEHLKSKCYLRKYCCELCGQEDTYQAITGMGGPEPVAKLHYATCPDYPLECPNKCGENGIKRKDMPSHREQCSLEPVQCPFQEAGCESRLVRRDLEDHVATQAQHHLMLTFQTMRKENSELRNRSAALENELKRVKAMHKQ